MSEELHDEVDARAEITLFAISAARFSTKEALSILKKRGIRANLIHLVWLKPFEMTSRILEPLRASGRGMVIDSAYEIAGASQSIAYNLMKASHVPVLALGQEDRSPGVAKHLENGTPTPQKIVDTVVQFLNERRVE